MQNITLDPEYENLIIEVNKLKEKVAEKIAERDMLAFHTVPDIETKYFSKIGVLENEAFLANLRLLKVNRKIELYQDKIKFNKNITEKEIEEQVDIEFDEFEEEYNDLQEEALFDDDDEFTNQLTEELLNMLNVVYKNLVKRLSPLINFDNTRVDNQLYELLERAYRELDLSIMCKLQSICDQIKPDSSLYIGDVKNLEKAKAKYTELIKENENIILHIKSSEAFDKKRILDDEKLIKKTKKEINNEISKIEEEIKNAEKEYRKIIKEQQ